MSGIVALLDRSVLGQDPARDPGRDPGRDAAGGSRGGPGAEAVSGPSSRSGPSARLAGLAERLVDALAYRGPDGRGTWHDGAVALGHALLRTRTRGEQREPGVVHDAEAGLHVVADARLDDRAELARALKAAGVSVVGGAPTLDAPAPALILAAWRVWGPDAPARLVGDFAFVLWDAPRRTLFAARDPFGVKPLFVAEGGGDGGWVALSNTLPALLEHPGVSLEPDERSIADWLFWGGIHDERRTCFADVRQVERGTWWMVGPEGVETGRHHRLPAPAEPRRRPRGEVLDEFGDLLARAVADRLPEGEEPTVLQLSGGLDSTTIATAAVGVRGGPEGFTALTLGYRRLFDDPEPSLARAAAASLGLEHELLWADDWLEPFPGMGADLPSWAVRGRVPVEPGFDLAVADHAALARHGRVTLTGWDGDALLGAGVRSWLTRLARQGRALSLARELGVLAAEGVRRRRPPRIGLRGALRARLAASHVDPMDGYPEGWLDPDFEARHDLREVWRRAVAPDEGDPTDPRRPARAALESGVWSGLFQEQDPGFTGVALEARHPLMDLRVLRFLLALPAVPWCVEKGLLRAWLEARLPAEVWRRKKQGLQGDPLILTFRERMTASEGRAALAALLAPDPKDPLVARRLLLPEWRGAFLGALEAPEVEGLPPYWGTRAHAVGRWLRHLEPGGSPPTGSGETHEDERGKQEEETLRPP